MTGSTEYQGRFRHHCGTCGRFVAVRDAHVVYDDYVGGYEADPHCPTGRGCAAPTPGDEPLPSGLELFMEPWVGPVEYGITATEWVPGKPALPAPTEETPA